MGDLQDKLDEILNLQWEEDDKIIMINIMKNAIYYKRLIPKTFEKDIIKCIDVCLKEKRDLDALRVRCTCIHPSPHTNL